MWAHYLKWIILCPNLISRTKNFPWFIQIWFRKWTIFQYFAWNIFRRQVTCKHLARIIFRGYKEYMKSLNLCFITSTCLLINNLCMSHFFALRFRKKKIREKLHTSLHYCLLFAIHICFLYFFLNFSRGLNSTDNIIWEMFHADWISRTEHFCDILCELYLAEKFKICETYKIRSTRKLTHRNCIR